MGAVDGRHRCSVCSDGYLSLSSCVPSETEECHFFYFVRLALVGGASGFCPGLERPSPCVGLGWPHLPGETEEETEVALIDYNYCVSEVCGGWIFLTAPSRSADGCCFDLNNSLPSARADGPYADASLSLDRPTAPASPGKVTSGPSAVQKKAMSMSASVMQIADD